jgi:hypothetical protein
VNDPGPLALIFWRVWQVAGLGPNRRAFPGQLTCRPLLPGAGRPKLRVTLMKHQFITVEDLRAAILAAAHDCDLERMHEIVLAYHRLTGQEEGEDPEVGRASRPKLGPKRRDNPCGND